jgi:threonine dehydratase
MVINLQDIERAANRIEGLVHHTPLMGSATLSKMVGVEVRFKPENLQKTGSFKIRGASNKVAHMLEAGTVRGVTTPSSGNHGQAVALAASRAGLPAVIVMPEDASPNKVEAARGYGAEVVFAGHTTPERAAVASTIAAERGYEFIHSYNDPDIMAGQGTLGLELAHDWPDVEYVLVPIGGGGLLSGVSTAVKSLCPSAKVIGVEPEHSNSMYVSRQAGQVTALPSTDTIADGLRSLAPGDLTFAQVQAFVDDIVLVSEEAIMDAIRFMLFRSKLVVEPSGAVGVAALLSGVFKPDARTAVVLSGGNISPKLVKEL